MSSSPAHVTAICRLLRSPPTSRRSHAPTSRIRCLVPAPDGVHRRADRRRGSVAERRAERRPHTQRRPDARRPDPSPHRPPRPDPGHRAHFERGSSPVRVRGSRPAPDPGATPDPAPTPDPAASAEPTPAAEPSLAPDPSPTTKPKAKPTSSEPAIDKDGRPIAAGRYIVILSGTADTAGVISRHGKRDGVKADRKFERVRAFSAKLDVVQRKALLSDPSVVAVVPDEVIEVTAQLNPTGVSRVGTRLSPAADIDTVDDNRVDADVAIVDTGVAYHPDLNVVGGVNCSTSDRTKWQDGNGHGTHVAGTVAAIDNTIGVVGVAPGARVWAVRILNSDGYGLLSWYVCGLDWILAQRDPIDSTRPLIEAVNMSVAKTGSDDHDCGFSNNDILHKAICRLYSGGITVVAAAANEHTTASQFVPAAYNEVITVSALADTDGKSGGLGGNRCYSWGTYDVDDTFADFSNYGGDVDVIAPGKCIWSTHPGLELRLLLRHLDGGSRGDWRGRPVQGQPSPRDSQRSPRVAPLPGQPRVEDLDRPGQRPRAVARRQPRRGTSESSPSMCRPRHQGPIGWRHRHGAGHGEPELHVLRTRPASASATSRAGWGASVRRTSLFGWSAGGTDGHDHRPEDSGAWHTIRSPSSAPTGAACDRVSSRSMVAGDGPMAKPPTAVIATGLQHGAADQRHATIAVRASCLPPRIHGRPSRATRSSTA